jgi:hypothetical protein
MWLGFSPWDQTLERWRQETGISDLDVAEYFGLEPFFSRVPLEYGPLPHFEECCIEENGEFVVKKNWRGIIRRERRDGLSMPEWLEHPVRTANEWEQYKRERLSGPLEERLSGLEAFAEKAGGQGLPVQVGLFPWGTFGTLRDLLGAENCLYAFCDQPDVVRDIIETNTALWLSVYERVAEKIQIDHVHIWEDMCSKQGSLISMPMVEEFLMPAYDKIVSFARENKVPIVSVDSDGRCDELVAVMTRHGINAFMPFEVQAGNDVIEFRKTYPDLGIMGGLDKRVLTKTTSQINAELKRAEWMLASGGYIVGFDHSIPPDVPWEPFCYAVEEIRKMILG